MTSFFSVDLFQPVYDLMQPLLYTKNICNYYLDLLPKSVYDPPRIIVILLHTYKIAETKSKIKLLAPINCSRPV